MNFKKMLLAISIMTFCGSAIAKQAKVFCAYQSGNKKPAAQELNEELDNFVSKCGNCSIDNVSLSSSAGSSISHFTCLAITYEKKSIVESLNY